MLLKVGDKSISPTDTVRNLGVIFDSRMTTVQRSTKTLKSADNKSFTYLAPRMWNNLPTTIRESQTFLIFKKRLKTYLFPV